MPSHTYKSAAVPFVNQKGERSMKRVKVERYVAGKKPSYAKEDEEEEYYTTDEEVSGEEEYYGSDEEEDISQSRAGPSTVDIYENHDDDDGDEDVQEPTERVKTVIDQQIPSPVDQSDSDEDDPRFRRLKQLDSKCDTSSLLNAQTSSRAVTKHIQDKIILDDEEDEEEIKQRHALAKAKTIDTPIGAQAILGDTNEQQLELKAPGENQKSLKEETEDILKDLKLEGFKPKSKKEKTDSRIEEQLKDMIDQAKQEAIFTAQIHKKIEEDNKIELEKEALRKGDIGAYDMESVKTDDEDDDIAYEEWKLREIKRVLRDRSERVIEAKAR